MLSQNEVLFDNFSGENDNRYRIVNDGVMGGLSQSSISKNENGEAVFSGQLSLENYGGFASVRILLDDQLEKEQLSKVNAIRLRVKGDGRTYSFRIRTNQSFDGVAYTQNFQTQMDEWVEVELPVADFRPSFRGRILNNVPALEATAIQQLGILLGDKKEGKFALKIAWIKGVVED